MTQDNKIIDINDLVIFLAATGMKPLLKIGRAHV